MGQCLGNCAFQPVQSGTGLLQYITELLEPITLKPTFGSMLRFSINKYWVHSKFPSPENCSAPTELRDELTLEFVKVVEIVRTSQNAFLTGANS